MRRLEGFTATLPVAKWVGEGGCALWVEGKG